MKPIIRLTRNRFETRRSWLHRALTVVWPSAFLSLIDNLVSIITFGLVGTNLELAFLLNRTRTIARKHRERREQMSS